MNASPAEALATLWTAVDGGPAAPDRVELRGNGPALPSSFNVGTAAQASIASAALMATELWRERTTRTQRITVEMRHAAAEFRSERYLRINGEAPRGIRDPLSGIYPCKGDGRVRPHLTFQHEKRIFLSLVLGDPENADRATLAKAIHEWNAEDLEEASNSAGVAAAALRSRREWADHPQAAFVAAEPLIWIERIGHAPPISLTADAQRSLSGVRVLDLTHVIAGPVCGRTLAVHGADVLAISAAHLSGLPQLVADVNRGKRSSFLDLRLVSEQERLLDLARGADVFIQSYRPASLDARGASPADIAAIRPGIVYGSLSAYGWTGPWRHKRGYDSLVQTATGFNSDEAAAAGQSEPKELPCQVLDHATGYLLALGITAALLRRSREGGSWKVRVSLALTGLWLRSLGVLDNGFEFPDQTSSDVADLVEKSQSRFGRLEAIRHSAELSETPAFWSRSSAPLGEHLPHW